MLVFPGDEVPQELSPSIKLGPGLGTETLQDGQVRLSATAPGILGQVSTTHTHGRGTHGDDKQPLAFWVESNNQRVSRSTPATRSACLYDDFVVCAFHA